MRNCEKMTELISASMERDLKFTEKLEKAFHTFMCSGCKNFEKNTHQLRKITKIHNQVSSKKTDQK